MVGIKLNKKIRLHLLKCQSLSAPKANLSQLIKLKKPINFQLKTGKQLTILIRLHY